MIHDFSTTARSTGHTNPARARQHVVELIRNGEAIPQKEPTFAVYAKDWWLWDRCTYVRAQRARSTPDKPAISPFYVHKMRRNLENHLLPFYGPNKKMKHITPADIDTLIIYLKDKSLSNKTVNHILGTLRVMLKEATRRRIIKSSPMEYMRPLPPDTEEKGILTDDEVQALLAEENIERFWNGQLLHYTANLVAASMGPRLGEIRGLRTEDIQGNILIIQRSYGKFGTGPTKGKRKRKVPIPSRTKEYLFRIAPPSGYFFSRNEGITPIHGNRIAEFFTDALERSSIPDKKRQARNISFHSWRHFIVSWLRRQGVPESIIRMWIGHTTVQMTEHYNHPTQTDFKEITALIESYY